MPKFTSVENSAKNKFNFSIEMLHSRWRFPHRRLNLYEGGSKIKNEELNTALYKKVFAEQEKYRKWLLSQPPDEILNHCYEYTVREDIVLALEEYDLSDKQCKALLKSPSPLADVFKDFKKRETDHMDNIRDTIECRANAVIRADFLRDRREAR